MTFLNFCKNRIRNTGGRITRSKELVIEVLAQAKTTLNPYQIAEIIEDAGRKVDVATVYRILEAFMQLNLVHKCEKGFIRCAHYQCENSNHCHHYFNCNNCRKTLELHFEDRDFLNLIQKKFNKLNITSHDFKFSGLCNDCS